jgi:hypothetical protein
MASARFEVVPGAIDRLFNSPESVAFRKKQARRIRDAWVGNIHRITGATERSITVEQHGDEIVVTADSSRNRDSAWAYLEYGTSRQRAQAPARRAVR